MVGSEFGVKNMKAWIHPCMPCLNFLAHFGPVVPIEHRLNATAYLSIVADHVHPFMTTVYHLLMATSSRIMHHVTKLKSSQTGFLTMTMSSLYSNGLQSPDLNPIEHLWDVVKWEIHIIDVQPTNLQQLHEAIMSIWTKISEECFQHLVKSMPRRIKAVLKTKGVQRGTSKVYLIKWPVSVCIYSGAKKYLVSHQLCKFFHLKR